MEQTLELAKKSAEEAEVYLTSYERTIVSFEANRLKQLNTTQGTLVSLRLVKDGRVGFSVSTGLQDRESLVNRALDVSQFGSPAEFDLPSQIPYPEIQVHDPEVDTVPMESMVAIGEELIAKVREHTPELVCDAKISKRNSSVCLINSRGGEANFQRTHSGVEIDGILVRGTDMLFVGDQDSSCQVIRGCEGVAQEVTRQLEWAKKEASVSSGRLPVVLTPLGVASAIVPSLREGFKGNTVLQGASPLQNRQGEKAFDKIFSLYDDATIPFRPRSRPCDDEGTPTQRTTLIDQGVVGDFLYDLQTAGLAKTRSTGNGKREMGIPSPKESALIVSEGDATFENMLRDMSEGLVVELLMGASQTNILGGDFSGSVLLGYKVEKGEIVGRVKNVVLSGNVYSALADVVAVGRESRWVGGSLCTPPLYLSSLAVASKG